jgi:hypothetical protein
LFKLVDNKDTAGIVASAVAYNFDKLPENVRNELLLKAANSIDRNENPFAGSYIADAVSRNFDKLPENIRDELQKRLAKHDYNIG